ncbi:MAG: hypothetical protein H0T45_12880 [Pyrinomonadaceae bacterium]|nr:hypothetical protein [Pyrinomonadaceae bacterium]
MVQLGYPKGYTGCEKFVEDLRNNEKTDWAYVAFITKYRLNYFAYAFGVHICMEFSNDGWGPNQINQVFAHETCHIFGAGDEYGSCVCSNMGVNDVPNNNCVKCQDRLFAHVPCLMGDNVLNICPWTMGQIGWINPRANSSPVYVEFFSQRHCLYVDKNKNISDILYANEKWQYQNLNKEKPEAPKAHGDPFSLVYYEQLHTLYRDVHDTISDILYNPNGKYWP